MFLGTNNRKMQTLEMEILYINKNVIITIDNNKQ
jgi:hypothetical protein